MLKINIVAMGDIKEKYFTSAIDEYMKRLSRFADVKIIELREHVAPSNNIKDIEQALNKDAIEIEKHLRGYKIALDINGNQFSSVEFSKKLDSIALEKSEITFIIGASNGIAKSIKDKCNTLISFSKMTFPHQLMRVIFLEQLYRAFTISKNIAYHK